LLKPRWLLEAERAGDIRPPPPGLSDYVLFAIAVGLTLVLVITLVLLVFR
jgi:hypothetical protein